MFHNDTQSFVIILWNRGIFKTLSKIYDEKQPFADVLKNFAIFTGKHLLESVLKVAGLQACNFIKKRLQHRRFPVNIAKFVRNPFLKEHLWWLLLYDGTVFAKKLHHRYLKWSYIHLLLIAFNLSLHTL